MKPEAFRAWRTKLGYTQAQAAENFKVSRVTIANWETGATRIPGMVEQMCSVLEMRWKMRDEFGPVTLVYGNGAMFVDPYKPIPPFQPLQREPFKTNQEAIGKACQITEGCQSLNIVDEVMLFCGMSCNFGKNARSVSSSKRLKRRRENLSNRRRANIAHPTLLRARCSLCCWAQPPPDIERIGIPNTCPTGLSEPAFYAFDRIRIPRWPQGRGR